ncbi:hypothetical protein ACVIIY_005002 [Bradyrhizobium sp. USDA 4515]|nr:hypothetical protein [Bradyrhizobium sp. USDA 4545]
MAGQHATWRDRARTKWATRPKCRCAERATALKRASEARLAGNEVAYAREMEFVKTSLQEDAAALKQWALRGS